MKVRVNGQEGIIPNELVKSITQDMGEIFPIDLRWCTKEDPCPNHKERFGRGTHPHKYYAAYIRGEPSLMEVSLITGETFYVEEIISKEDE